MASFFEASDEVVEILDAGSGEGALTIALVRSLINKGRKPKQIIVTAYEIDLALMAKLRANLIECAQDSGAAGIPLSFTAINADFISVATDMVRGSLYAPRTPKFTAAILNPPYKKIRSDSSTRHLLRSAGIETTNLYAAFIALTTKLLVKGGELVAITPRSYCNGPYFRPFRSGFLEAMSLRRLHVFESRSAAFRDDKVLQENVIVHAVREGSEPAQVLISTSSGKSGDVLKERTVHYDQVVLPGDSAQFIHLPIEGVHNSARVSMGGLKHSLRDLELQVSTGRVVDFRARPYLRHKPTGDTAPLIYACHFNGGFIHWPNVKTRKPNAILISEETRDLLIPAGIYVVVKRFTAKEERRRIVACVYDPDRVNASLVGFENHLNYFHLSGSGMQMHLAKGLAAFLNSTFVDDHFRQFSGHTQVNATDLRKLPYPARDVLENIGNSIDCVELPQAELDRFVERKLV
jgi:adenine-specific DNA-methyltransferase